MLALRSCRDFTVYRKSQKVSVILHRSAQKFAGSRASEKTVRLPWQVSPWIVCSAARSPSRICIINLVNSIRVCSFTSSPSRPDSHSVSLLDLSSPSPPRSRRLQPPTPSRCQQNTGMPVSSPAVKDLVDKPRLAVKVQHQIQSWSFANCSVSSPVYAVCQAVPRSHRALFTTSSISLTIHSHGFD